MSEYQGVIECRWKVESECSKLEMEKTEISARRERWTRWTSANFRVNNAGQENYKKQQPNDLWGSNVFGKICWETTSWCSHVETVVGGLCGRCRYILSLNILLFLPSSLLTVVTPPQPSNPLCSCNFLQEASPAFCHCPGLGWATIIKHCSTMLPKLTVPVSFFPHWSVSSLGAGVIPYSSVICM